MNDGVDFGHNQPPFLRDKLPNSTRCNAESKMLHLKAMLAATNPYTEAWTRPNFSGNSKAYPKMKRPKIGDTTHPPRPAPPLDPS
jgi:hypothetical protein